MMDVQNLTLDVEQSIEIKAAIDDVFSGLIRRLSVNNTRPDDEPLPMSLECRPGGRWFRDLGNDTGHLWGFVQVIKPPKLLEIQGPMFMSYPVSGHLSLRLTEVDGGTQLSLRHRAFGFIEDDHRQGATAGWEYYLNGVRCDCE